MPADAHALADFPTGQAGADRVDHAGHFMSWNSRILNARKQAILDDRVAVANAAGVNFDSQRAGPRFGDWPLDDFQRTAETRNLNSTHRGHDFLLKSLYGV